MTSPSRGGRKTESIDNRIDYFNRAHVYITCHFRRDRKTEATHNRLDSFNRVHVL